MHTFLFCLGVFIAIAYLSWLMGWVTYNKVAGKKVCCEGEKPTVPSRKITTPVGSGDPAREPLVDPVTGDFNWRANVASNDQDIFMGTRPDDTAIIETLPAGSIVMSEELKKAYDNFWVGDLQKETPEEIELAKQMEIHRPGDFCGPDGQRNMLIDMENFLYKGLGSRDEQPKPKKVRKPRVAKPDPILGVKPEQPKRRRGGSRGTGGK